MSSNKKVEPILAYSESGTFNVSKNRLPEGLTFWLNTHIKYVDSLEKSQSPVLEDAWKLENIRQVLGEKLNFDLPKAKITCTPYSFTKPSLNTINWGQGNGYNDQCPNKGCSYPNPTNGKAPTGCIATAMGEIMYYHKKPASPNWPGMPSNGNPSADVALLLRVIGLTVNMNYGCGGSGATMNAAKNAFITSFGYSNAKKSDYNSATIKTQLIHNRPVMMSGGSHAWVTDGFREYQSTDCTIGYLYFWMNWGWEGSYNGWYGVSAFNPGGRNYNSNVQIIYDLY